ncbi:MAG: glycine cleavage system protein GcvH [Candidatus Tectomicrobia bacterium]|nr:glycine cleavage system protein GcvH [Candidatus Tectomicrobia bacterium]
MEFPEGLRYTKEHEWTRVEGERAVIGITDFAQHELGDVVYVELPKVGGRVTQFVPFGVVESVKAVSDLYAPVSGEIVEVNGDLENHPEVINADPYGTGWMIVVALSDPNELEKLLSAQEYAEYLKEAGE